jgi:hypothetical protein
LLRREHKKRGAGEAEIECTIAETMLKIERQRVAENILWLK